MLVLKSHRLPFLQQCLCSSLSTYNVTNYLNCHLNYFLSNQIPDIQSLLQSHAYIITTGNADNLFFAAKLISLYSSFCRLNSSSRVFNSIAFKDTFLWNSIIKSYFSNGQCAEALEFYQMMRQSDTLPNHFTIPMVVTSCAELMLVNYGMNIHGLASKSGLLAGNSAAGSSFVHMYSKCGRVDDACLVFDEIRIRDVVAWTALVIGYVQNGENEKGLEYLCEMHRIGRSDKDRPNFRTLEGGFQACGNLGAVLEGRCLHGLVVKSGIGCSQVVQSSLFSMYAKCETPQEEAYLSFLEVLDKDIISWTLIIGVYARLGYMIECLRMFSEMQAAQIYPDGVVISCMLLGFANSMMVHEGKAFHGFIIRRCYVLNEMIHNALLSMYCKFGLLALSENLFRSMKECNRDCWNTMIFGFSKMGLEVKCIELFREMQFLGIESDSNSLVSVISSCSQLRALHLGSSVHSYVIKSSNDKSISVVNSLIDMYGKYGDLTIAMRVFCRAERDVVTWNTLISSYSHSGLFPEALDLFDKMILEDVKPTIATLVTVLSACSHIASLEHGDKVHKYIKREKFEFNLSLATSLVDMYAKCGGLTKAREIFNSMKERDVICWNVMISGYGMHGDAKSALEIFQQMEKSSVRPNGLSFLAILSACTHAGLIEEGKYLFDRMQDYYVRPNLKHYACMVDLLGRSGNLQEAEALIQSMPVSPDGCVWGALLNACKLHNEIEMGIRIAKLAIESDPENDGYYIMISNLYSSLGRWEEADGMREMMKERRVGKTAGWSAV
ncbi:pentatricopeptide repeat-containing protein At4g39952, mitochondrial [Malania oleifera]|uniref:pentatricopeptide repeat-containing protein At4g39952, mitochondrial n=1 Tax=Malania oleifera TaxID=397392 RepID=UPI0025ADBAF6|nr:pentatricopeptide repeat-containing protein At4g39952, mitochondrial [Malania oleifera]